MSVLKFKKSVTEEKNILHSIEYLIQEADRLGFEDIRLELSTALSSIRSENSLSLASLLDQSDDTEKTKIFEILIRFIRSDIKSQKHFLEVVDNLK